VFNRIWGNLTESVNYLLKRLDDGFILYSLDDLRSIDATEDGLHKYEFIVGFPVGYDVKPESLENITDLSRAIERSLKEREEEIQQIGDEMTDLVISTYDIDLFPTLRETYQNFLNEYSLIKGIDGKYTIDPGRRELIIFGLAKILHQEGVDGAFVKAIKEGVNFREATIDLKMRMEKLSNQLKLFYFDVASMSFLPIKFNSFNEFDNLYRTLIGTYNYRYRLKNQSSPVLKSVTKTLEKIQKEKYD